MKYPLAAITRTRAITKAAITKTKAAITRTKAAMTITVVIAKAVMAAEAVVVITKAVMIAWVVLTKEVIVKVRNYFYTIIELYKYEYIFDLPLDCLDSISMCVM